MGPVDIDAVIEEGKNGKWYVDGTFAGKEALYWEDFADDWIQEDYDDNLASGYYYWARMS